MILLFLEILDCPTGSKAIIANAVTDLPLPDSPTNATVVFGGIWKEIPLTVSVSCLFSPLKQTLIIPRRLYVKAQMLFI